MPGGSVGQSFITPADAEVIGKQVRGFIADSVIPLEQEALAGGVTDVRLAGGAGVTEESVTGRIYADIRAFRIYDGPSEAHRAAIARRAVSRIRQAAP